MKTNSHETPPHHRDDSPPEQAAPKWIDRKRGAALITDLYFQISPRTLEKWPIAWRYANGRATCETEELLNYAKAKLDAAPAIKGMSARQDYEAEVISTFAKMGRPEPGMSDAQLAWEVGMQFRVQAACKNLMAVLEQLKTGSQLVKIDTQAFENFIHDELPSDTVWDEKISAARRGAGYAAIPGQRRAIPAQEG